MLNARMNCFTMGYAASTIGVTPDVFRNSFNPLIEQFYETIEKNARDNIKRSVATNRKSLL
jgi:hypothetical protein